MLKSTANKALLVAALVSVFAPAMAAGEATKGVTVNVTTAAPAGKVEVAPAAPATPGKFSQAYSTVKGFYTDNSRFQNIFNVIGSLAILNVAWDVVSRATASNSAE